MNHREDPSTKSTPPLLLIVTTVKSMNKSYAGQGRAGRGWDIQRGDGSVGLDDSHTADLNTKDKLEYCGTSSRIKQ